MNDMTPIRMLLVEDDAGDRKLILRSIQTQRLANHVSVAETAEKAITYLGRAKAGDEECPMPELILLDLNMPGMGGKEFLRRLKLDPELDTIPVVILTTSDSEQDVLDSYKLHAAGYIKKPIELKEFQAVMTTLENYWFMICRRAHPAA